MMISRGTVLVLLATLGLALKGIWAKLAYAEGMDVAAVLFYRSALAAPLVLVCTWWLLRREATRERAHRPASGLTCDALDRPAPAGASGARDWVLAASFGAFFAVGMYFDFTAIERLGAGVSRVLLFGYPLLVMMLGALQNRVLPSGQKLLGFLVAWSGLLLVASPALLGGRTFGPAALSWGFLSMAFYGLYVFLTGQLATRMGSVRLTGASNLSTAAVVVSFLLLQRGGLPSGVTAQGLLWVSVMVVVSTVFPYFLLMEGIRRLGSSEASLLTMSGPLVTVCAGYLVLGEQMSPLQWLGTGLTLLGVGQATGKLLSAKAKRPHAPRAPADTVLAPTPLSQQLRTVGCPPKASPPKATLSGCIGR